MQAVRFGSARVPQTSGVSLISRSQRVLYSYQVHLRFSPFPSVYNINIENTYGKPAFYSQAVALSALGTRFGVYGCQIRGYQDTLLANYVRSSGIIILLIAFIPWSWSYI